MRVIDETIGRIAATNWPSGTVAGGHLLRDWAVRVADEVTDSILRESTGLSGRVVSDVQDALGGTVADLPADFVKVQVLFVDERHVILRIAITSGAATTEAGMAATVSAIRRLDEVARIDDLQGIPRRFWLFLSD